MVELHANYYVIYIYNVFCIYIYIYIILYNYDSSSFIRLPSESSCFFALCSASHWEQPSSHHTSSHMIPHDMISDINSTSTFFFFMAMIYPLVICYIAIEHGPFTVDLPFLKMVIFQFANCKGLPEGNRLVNLKNFTAP